MKKKLRNVSSSALLYRFLLPLHEFVQKGNDRHLALVLPSEFETLSVHCLASNRSRFIRVF